MKGAASEVLTYLFPDKNATVNETMYSKSGNGDLNRSLLSLLPSVQFGQIIGKQVVSYANYNGSDVEYVSSAPTGDCKWKGDDPIEPMAGQCKTLILTSGAEIQPPPPEPCDSEKYKKQMQHVVVLSYNRTADQIKSIHY